MKLVIVDDDGICTDVADNIELFEVESDDPMEDYYGEEDLAHDVRTILRQIGGER